MELSKLDGSNMLYQPSDPFHMTERCKINTGYICNAKCHFCYFADSKLKNFSLDSIKFQLNIAYEYGIKDVDFSGGEPTIHSNFLAMLDYAKKLNFRTRCAITNGTTFQNKIFLKLCYLAGLNDILFSFHGPESIQNEIVGVNKAYYKMVHSIENANELGIRTRVNTVVSSKTYKHLPELAKILKQFNIFNYNIIMFKHCYDQTNAEISKTPRHIEAAKYIKEAIDICKETIQYINVRYIPFCSMKGYEKHVVNYNQKKYDPLEWVNSLLVKFYQPEDKIMSMCLDFLEEDKMRINNEAIKNYSSNAYVKSNRCIRCKHFLICDGFEKDYASKFNIDSEIIPYSGKKIFDPLHYRYNYYEEVMK